MAERPADGDPGVPGGSPEDLEDAAARARWLLSRRTFLIGAAGVVGVAYVKPNRLLHLAFPTKATLDADIVNPITQPINPIGGPFPDIVIAAERESDLVLLDFAFYGFSVQAGSPPAITPTSANNTVVIQFPPQAIGEGVYTWDNNNLPVDPPPILSDLSGPSRLCFRVPTGSSIPLTTMTVSDLLDWSDWTLLVPAVAQVRTGAVLQGPSPEPEEPGDFETAIEFPYAMFLAPTVDVSGFNIDFGGFTTGFAGRSEPLVSPAGVVDLWSASLVGAAQSPHIVIGPGGPPAPTPPYVPQVSAVWSADFQSLAAFAPTPNDTPEHEIEYDLVIIK